MFVTCACATAIVAAAALAGGCAPGAEPERSSPPPAAPERGSQRPDPWSTSAGAYAIARVRAGRSIALRSRPSGSVVKRVRSRTEFGSRRFLGVAERDGDWLGVVTAERPNGRLGWVNARSRALAPYRTDVSLHVDLSERMVELRSGERVTRRFRAGVGRAAYPTPTGRFAVTDKLSGRPYGGTYGCCIIALSGHQTSLPPGWPGGDRLALHGTRDEASIGGEASTGCLRASDRDLRALFRHVPLGSPVFIRS